MHTCLTWEGARVRYPDGVPEAVVTQVEKELALIAECGYEMYFLTVHDIVRYARSQGILCQGRGSAANSAVCYCLGITADLQIFQRFNALIEERYAEHWPLSLYASRIGVTEATSAGASPTCRRSAWCTNGLCRSPSACCCSPAAR